MADFTTEQVRDLTNKAERCENLSNDLNAHHLSERVDLAKAMRDLNQSDRQENKHLPRVDLTIGVDAGRTEHLLDVQCVKDPSALMFKGKADIYDMPKNADRLYFNAFKMTADTLDSSSRFSDLK